MWAIVGIIIGGGGFVGLVVYLIRQLIKHGAKDERRRIDAAGRGKVINALLKLKEESDAIDRDTEKDKRDIPNTWTAVNKLRKKAGGRIVLRDSSRSKMRRGR